MALTVVPIHDIAPDEWDALVHGSPDGWVFGLWGWQKLVTEVDPWGFEELGFGLHDGSKLVAVMPLHFQPSSRTAASSGWGGAGPIVANGIGPQYRNVLFARALDEATARAQERNATRLDVSISPVTTSSTQNRWSVNPLALSGFSDTSPISQIVALDSDDEALLGSFSQFARRQIRKASAAGYSAKEVNWQSAVDTYYEIHCETYNRTGASPHPQKYFEGIAKLIAPRGFNKLFAAFSPQGEIVAFHNTAIFGIGASYHTGCSRTAHMDCGVNYLLFWEAMKAAKKAGANWYECGLIFPRSKTAKLQGLTDLKTRFGGEPHRSFRGELMLEPASDQPAFVNENIQARTNRRYVGKLLSRLLLVR